MSLDDCNNGLRFYTEFFVSTSSWDRNHFADLLRLKVYYLHDTQ